MAMYQYSHNGNLLIVILIPMYFLTISRKKPLFQIKSEHCKQHKFIQLPMKYDVTDKVKFPTEY